MSRRPSLLLAAVAAAVALGVSGCGTVGGSAHAQADPAPIGTDSAAPAAPATAAAPTAGAQGGSGASAGGGAAAAPAPGKAGSTSAPAAAAKVTALSVTRQPSCPVQASPGAPFSQPGTDVEISWTVTGAPGAAVAVDNPGVYGAYGAGYPAKGSLRLAFPCDPTGTTKHTYTVWPSGVTDTSKSITVSARAGG
jgi:hypothetical protein